MRYYSIVLNMTHIDTGVVVVAKGDAWGREADGRREAVLTGTEQHSGVADVEEWQYGQVGILSCIHMCLQRRSMQCIADPVYWKGGCHTHFSHALFLQCLPTSYNYS